jgi:hypothetical protein
VNPLDEFYSQAYIAPTSQECPMMLQDELSFSADHDVGAEPVAAGQLPARLRLLCVGTREPSWVGLTLQLDAEGGIEPQFRWASSASEALSLLRDDPFDCVLIAATDARLSSNCGTIQNGLQDAATLVKGIRASGCEDPLVLIAPQISDAAWVDLSADECELLQSVRAWDSPALVATIKRAIFRADMVRQHRRLAVAQTKRMARERDEAEHLLSQQRRIIDDLDARDELAAPTNVALQAMLDCFGNVSVERFAPPRATLPAEINTYYHELLRTYVIMGSGNLSDEIAKLAELLAVAGCGPREVLALHLERVESLVSGLGNRSTRHIMARADLLALELMIHLGESYRRRCL